MSKTGTNYRGVERNKYFDDQLLENVDFDAATFEDCSFKHTRFVACSAYYLSLHRCNIVAPQFSLCGEWNNISVSDCVVEDLGRPLDHTIFNRIESTIIRGLTISGGYMKKNSALILKKSVFEGCLQSISLSEDRSHNQLVDCDLTNCSLTNVQLVGIPVERCKLPELAQRFVCRNWYRVAPEVFSTALTTLNDRSASDAQRIAASIIIKNIQLDASKYLSCHNADYVGPSAFNLPAERGSRLIDELFETQLPTDVVRAIKELYSPWISEV